RLRRRQRRTSRRPLRGLYSESRSDRQSRRRRSIERAVVSAGAAAGGESVAACAVFAAFVHGRRILRVAAVPVFLFVQRPDLDRKRPRRTTAGVRGLSQGRFGRAGPPSRVDVRSFPTELVLGIGLAPVGAASAVSRSAAGAARMAGPARLCTAHRLPASHRRSRVEADPRRVRRRFPTLHSRALQLVRTGAADSGRGPRPLAVELGGGTLSWRATRQLLRSQ